jgi:preprotein translocase subunit SecB
MAEGETRPTAYALEVGLNLTAGIASNDKDAEVRMAVRVTADPRVKPYVIEVEVLGQFSMVSGTRENFQAFVHRLAPALLFPYVREIVDRTTIDGRYGVIRLDPMNLQAAINHDEWKPIEIPANVVSSAPSHP